MPSTSHLTATFERDGVVSLGRILDDATLADLRTRLDRLVFNHEGRRAAGVRNVAGHREQAVMQRPNLYQVDEQFRALALRSDVLDAVSACLGPDVRLFMDECFYKPSQTGGEVYMHQDNAYWELDSPGAVALFVALDDCTAATGCVYYLLGSHRAGAVDHQKAAQARNFQFEALADKSACVPMELAAGAACIHHCHVLHWSPPNRSTQTRRAHTIHYVAADVTRHGQPLTDRLLVRGQARSAQLESAGN